jgi:folylpolyglutamate synthase/dihydropteroate synthase
MMKGEMAKPGLVCAHVIRIEYELILSADRNLKNRFSPEVQERYAKVWKSIDQKATVLRERTIEEALHRAKEIGDQNDGMQTLVTGSLHLVSGALNLLRPDLPI